MRTCLYCIKSRTFNEWKHGSETRHYGHAKNSIYQCVISICFISIFFHPAGTILQNEKYNVVHDSTILYLDKASHTEMYSKTQFAAPSTLYLHRSGTRSASCKTAIASTSYVSGPGGYNYHLFKHKTPLWRRFRWQMFVVKPNANHQHDSPGYQIFS